MAQQQPEKKPRRRVKKVKGHGGHHGGAWKVAYADFVTAMMALFLVLWLVSQADTKLKEAIANYFRSPGVFTSVEGGILRGQKKVSKEPVRLDEDDVQALTTAAVMLRKQFEKRPDFSKYKDQIKIEMTEEGLKIQILDQAERVSFASGSAALTPEASSIIGEIAQAVCALPNPITIGGHTDRRTFPPNSPYTNWELSADRANAARRTLEAACISSDRIRRIVGYADTQPIRPEDPYAAANRRISIVVLRMNAPAKEEDESDEPAADGDPFTMDVPLAKSPHARPAETPAAADPAETHAGDESHTPEGHAGSAPGRAEDKRSEEARLAEAKLKSQGSVTVGEPDALPASATKHRERRPARH